MFKRSIVATLFLFGYVSFLQASATIEFKYGDHSGSGQEQYRVHIVGSSDIGPVSIFLPTSPPKSSGQQTVLTIPQFLENGTYTAELLHVGGQGDFDYTFFITRLSGSQLEIIDTDGVLGIHDESSFFYAVGELVPFIVGPISKKAKEDFLKSVATSGDPVNLNTGALDVQETDLKIPGRGLDVEFTRSHNSNILNSLFSILGSSWSTPYSQRLQQIDGSSDIEFVSGAGRIDTFPSTGVNLWGPNAHENRDLVYDVPNNEFVMTADGEMKYIFHDFTGNHPGRLKFIRDRFNNQLSFIYGNGDLLTFILDAYSRPIQLRYNDSGNLIEIEDFSGRIIRYTYYDETEPTRGDVGMLKSVEAPDVFTSTGNNFFGSNRKTTTYEYNVNGVTDPMLRNNITTITDAKGQVYLDNEYATTENPDDLNYNRVIRQRHGPNGYHNFYWQEGNWTFGSEAATLLCITNDRRGVVTETYMNDSGNPVATKVFVDFAPNPDAQTTLTLNRPPSNNHYLTLKTFDSEGRLMTTTLPRGNKTTVVYNLAASDRHGQDNPLSNTRSDEAIGDEANIVTSKTYEDDFQLVKTETDGNGNVTTYHYDHESGPGFGLVTQIDRPVITQGLAAQESAGGTQIIQEFFEYNQFGQITKSVDGEGREIEYIYYPNFDPDGDGIPVPGSFDFSLGGYLHKKVVDPQGLTLTTEYKYDAVGNVIQIIDPNGHITTYEVNQLNQVVKETSSVMSQFDEDGSVQYEKHFYYDGNDNVEKIWTKLINSYDDTDADVAGFDGAEFFEVEFTFDMLDNVLTKREEVTSKPGFSSERTTTYEYDASENLSKIIYPNGDQDFMEYESRDLLSKKHVGFGDPIVPVSVTTYVYDPNGNLLRTIYPSGTRIEENTHDGFDRVKTFTDVGINTTVTYTYDANSNVTQTDINGAKDGSGTIIPLSVTDTKYDAINRPYEVDFSIIDHEGVEPTRHAFTRTGFDKNSLVYKTVNANGNAVTHTFDGANRLSTTTDGEGNIMTYVYDANSNIIQEISSEVLHSGGTGDFNIFKEYDEINRLRRVRDDLGNETAFHLDSRGLITTQRDAEGNDINRRFDGLSRKIEEYRDAFESGQITLSWLHDERSRMTEFTDGRGNKTSFTYDSHNRVTTRVNADTPPTTRQYLWDTEDNLMTLIRENDHRIEFNYDASNRLIERIFKDDTGTKQAQDNFQYNGLSVLTRIEEVDAVDALVSYLTYQRDSRHLVLSCTKQIVPYPPKIFTMEYDDFGNLKKMTHPNNRVIRFKDYNSIELLTRITTNGFDADASASQKDLVRYDYDGYGRVARKTLANGYELGVGYDPVKRVKTYLHKNNADSKVHVGFIDVYDGVYNRRAEIFLDDEL